MKKTKSAAKKEKPAETLPLNLIDAQIKELGDWRGEMLARVRDVIRRADPDVVEAWKWRGVPVWEHAGIICTGGTYKGRREADLCQGRLGGGPVRTSSIRASTATPGVPSTSMRATKIDEPALKALIRAAVALNTSAKRSKTKA